MVVLAIVAVVLTVGAKQTGATSSGCIPPAGTTDTSYSKSAVRVFNTPDTTVACNVRAGLLVTIATGGSFLTAQYAVAGRFLRFIGTQDDFDQTHSIRSVDLFTGRYGHQVRFSSGAGIAEDIVARSNGSIAWVQQEADHPAVVRLADTHGVGVPRGGHGVTRHTLRLSGSRLTWKRRGHTYPTVLS